MPQGTIIGKKNAGLLMYIRKRIHSWNIYTWTNPRCHSFKHSDGSNNLLHDSLNIQIQMIKHTNRCTTIWKINILFSIYFSDRISWWSGNMHALKQAQKLFLAKNQQTSQLLKNFLIISMCYCEPYWPMFSQNRNIGFEMLQLIIPYRTISQKEEFAENLSEAFAHETGKWTCSHI